MTAEGGPWSRAAPGTGGTGRGGPGRGPTRPRPGGAGERRGSRGWKANMAVSSSDMCYKLHTKVQTAPGLGLPGIVGV